MYTKAIVRKPGRNFADGLTTANSGKPDLKKTLEQHEAYCNALIKCGLDVITLEADAHYPDGCFVEDTAIVTEKMAIITKPGAPERLGEEEKIAAVLSAYKPLEAIALPGHVDGGDILRAGDHFYIGVSERTNGEGAKQLAGILSKYGYSSSEIPVQAGLHLKSGAAWLGNDRFISTDAFSGAFGVLDVIVLDREEEDAANCLLANNTLLIAKGFPKAKQKFSDLGYRIIALEMSEFRKMDGSLTCLSLLF